MASIAMLVITKGKSHIPLNHYKTQFSIAFCIVYRLPMGGSYVSDLIELLVLPNGSGEGMS